MYTTVILAQPRGPRLRADAVYVDRRGSTGHDRASSEIDCFSRGLGVRRPPFFAPELAPSPGALAKKNVQKSPMATPILAQKSGPNVGHVSLTAEKQPFPLKSGVHIASVMVTKMDFSVYENLCFFWILMPRGCPGAPD